MNKINLHISSFMVRKWRFMHLSKISCIIGVLCVIFVLTSCLDKNAIGFSDNVDVSQSFSVPIGQKKLTLGELPLMQPSEIPGTFGSFYYNNLIYPNNSNYFFLYYFIDFNLSSKTNKSNRIQKVDVSVLLTNSFPTKSYAQVYIQDYSPYIIDSVFTNGPLVLSAATTNLNGRITNAPIISTIVSFEGTRLNNLKQATTLLCRVAISSIGDKDTLRLTNNNNVNINLGLRISLKYNINEIKN